MGRTTQHQAHTRSRTDQRILTEAVSPIQRALGVAGFTIAHWQMGVCNRQLPFKKHDMIDLKLLRLLHSSEQPFCLVRTCPIMFQSCDSCFLHVNTLRPLGYQALCLGVQPFKRSAAMSRQDRIPERDLTCAITGQGPAWSTESRL